MKKVLLSILLTLLPILASADPVEVDGIWYNLITKALAAEVTYSPSSNKYSGDVIIPEKFTYEGVEYCVTKIANSAFLNCSGLTSVTIGNSVEYIGNEAFSRCSGLTSVTIGNNVTSIGVGAFYYCPSLKSVHISDIEAWCGIAFNSDDSNPLYYAKHLYVNGEEIKDLIIPNSVESIGARAFYDCCDLSFVTIGNSVENIGKEAFYHCIGLTSVTIPNSVTTISARAFYDCSGLSSVTIGNSVEYIGIEAFYRCSGLTSVIIPNSVISINQNAFKDCDGLSSVTIGSHIKNVYNQAFASCDELMDVYCLADKVSKDNSQNHEGIYTDPDAFKDSYPQSMTLHVPATSIEAYRTMEPWSTFNAIVPLEAGDIPETQKCATPEISYEKGKVKFTCETEGVDFISEVTVSDAKKYYDSEFTLSQKYKISVYATKAGYYNSDTTAREIEIKGDNKPIVIGDVDGDGKVNVADHVKLSDIIMNK